MTDHKTSEAQLAAVRKYKQKNLKQYTIGFYPADADILEHLNKQPVKQAYIKDLIRKDMENSKVRDN